MTDATTDSGGEPSAETRDGEQKPAALPVLPSAIRSAVVAELSRLEEFVDTLTPADLSSPSAAGGWTVVDVVAHLQLVFALYNRLLSAAARGRTGGRIGKALGNLTRSVVPAASPALNAVNSALPHLLTKTLAPEAVQGQLLGGARSLRQRVAKLESGDYTKPIYYRGGPWPLSFFLAAMVNEMALHRWDMESLRNPNAHLSEDARSVLPWYYWAGTSFMYHPEGTAGSVAMALEDPSAELSWEGTAPVRGLLEKPEATVRGESGTVVLALGRRISPDDAIRTTSVKIEGNEDLGKRFLSGWRIV